MSSLTSLSVNKNNTRFTPKVKARAARRAVLPAREAAEEIESTDNVPPRSNIPAHSREKQPVREKPPTNVTPTPTPTRGISINVPTNEANDPVISQQNVHIPLLNDGEDAQHSKRINDNSNDEPTSSKRAREKAPANSSKRRRQREMLTLDDISYDPATEASVDQPLIRFTTDLDIGIVSKTFKEFEERRMKKRNKGGLSGKELKEHMQRGFEEQERKRAQALEEEARQASSVLSEASNAVQVRLVNGEIVLDTDTLLIDRQRRDSHMDDTLEVVEEHEMSRRVNSNTHGKKTGNLKWSTEETAMFYDALAQHGTDFETISKIIPHRSRRQVKLKFTREEKQCPWKITEYLTKKRRPAGKDTRWLARVNDNVDLDQLQEITGQIFENVPDGFDANPEAA